MIKKARDKVANRLRIVQELFADEEIVTDMLRRVARKRAAVGNPISTADINGGLQSLKMLLFRDVPALLAEWPTVQRQPQGDDKARQALQAIADAEPGRYWHGAITDVAVCDRCREMIAMAREGLTDVNA